MIYSIYDKDSSQYATFRSDGPIHIEDNSDDSYLSPWQNLKIEIPSDALPIGVVKDAQGLIAHPSEVSKISYIKNGQKKKEDFFINLIAGTFSLFLVRPILSKMVSFFWEDR